MTRKLEFRVMPSSITGSWDVMARVVPASIGRSWRRDRSPRVATRSEAFRLVPIEEATDD